MPIVKCCMTNLLLFAGFSLSFLAAGGSAVLHVTTLAPKGPGSLRETLETNDARLVVFEVGGVIDLGGQPLSVKRPYFTVAGQIAPAPGITPIRVSLVG